MTQHFIYNEAIKSKDLFNYYFNLLKFYYSKIKVPENKIVRQLVQGIVLSNAYKKNLDQLTLFKNSRHFAHRKIPKYKKIFIIL